MNTDDIIRMAREAGLHLATDVHWMPIIGLEYAQKFAAIVAATEREACAKVCEIGTGEPVQMKTLEILRQERERIAFVIRERGAP